MPLSPSLYEELIFRTVVIFVKSLLMLCYLWWASHVAETFQRFWVLVGYYVLPIISYLASIAFCLMDQWYVALNSLCFQLLWKSVLKCLIRKPWWLDASSLNCCSAAMLSSLNALLCWCEVCMCRALVRTRSCQGCWLAGMSTLTAVVYPCITRHVAGTNQSF
jgi:hypothetical protein